MQRGEYSHLLHQIRDGRAEHLADDAWRVTLLEHHRVRALLVRARPWRLITILPRDWTPPGATDEQQKEQATPERATAETES
jgi:hypothetical protein